MKKELLERNAWTLMGSFRDLLNPGWALFETCDSFRDCCMGSIFNLNLGCPETNPVHIWCRCSSTSADAPTLGRRERETGRKYLPKPPINHCSQSVNNPLGPLRIYGCACGAGCLQAKHDGNTKIHAKVASGNNTYPFEESGLSVGASELGQLWSSTRITLSWRRCNHDNPGLPSLPRSPSSVRNIIIGTQNYTRNRSSHHSWVRENTPHM